ncbi:ClpP/crotonase-like domain-containing protein [Gongronella butleri]|nr:ClpP/crotonase-like domain-containing protein [Gongronella butleri]
MPYQYDTIKVDVAGHVAHVQMNRPTKLNAFNPALLRDMTAVFQDLDADSAIRAVVVSGAGRMFTAGLDLQDNGLTATATQTAVDIARATYNTREKIRQFQNVFTAIEKCQKPVLAAIHGACLGAGVDMITACDVRYATKDAFFAVKEVTLGLAADVGSLQRLPKVIGNQSFVREVCFTARDFGVDEAYQHGLVSRVFDTKDAMIHEALNVAAAIASKSPVAVVGTKHNLLYSRDHSVSESLDYQLTWSSAMLNTEDIPKSFQAFVTKKPAEFSKL